MRARPLLWLLLAAAQAGCLAGEGETCSTDADCAADGECTRTGECVPDGAALRVVVRWTVNGQAPAPGQPEVCAGIGELEVRFLDPGEEAETYRPVPCSLGQVVYDKMPPRFESVEVLAHDADGREVDSVEVPLSPSGETTVDVDLVPARSG